MWRETFIPVFWIVWIALALIVFSLPSYTYAAYDLAPDTLKERVRHYIKELIPIKDSESLDIQFLRFPEQVQHFDSIDREEQLKLEFSSPLAKGFSGRSIVRVLLRPETGHPVHLGVPVVQSVLHCE